MTVHVLKRISRATNLKYEYVDTLKMIFVSSSVHKFLETIVYVIVSTFENLDCYFYLNERFDENEKVYEVCVAMVL